MTRIKHLGKHAKRLWMSEEGAVAPLVGFCMIMLIGAVAVAVDIGRGQVAQSKLQASLDSAGLAAGAMVGQNLDEETLKPEAEKYLNANFQGFTIDATITNFDLNLSEDETVVTLEAEASLPTTFMRIFGKNSMEVSARSEITREMTGLEVALVLDVTGSMDDPVGGSPTFDNTKKIAALRTAGVDLVNILFGDNDEVDDLWVGVVPFSQSVNIGTDHADWVEDLSDYTDQVWCNGPTSGTPRCSSSDPYWTGNTANVSTRTNPITRVDQYMFADRAGWYFSPHTWRGCVLERWEDGLDETDDTPDVEKWKTYFVPDTVSASSGGNNNWRTSTGGYAVNDDHDDDGNDEETGANKGCPEQAITTLTNQKADLLAAINGLVYPRGNTHLPVGAVWGWRLLSPEWRGLWGGDMDSNDLPLEYDEPLSQKAMIFMTDGMNTMSGSIYTAWGWLADGNLGSTSSGGAVTALNNKTTAICNAMKAKGVLIYTIVFGNGSNTTAKNLMKNCASETDFYFFSPSADALKTAFKAIGDSLSKLRISR